MKTAFTSHVIRSSSAILLAFATCLGLAPAARAGLTVDMHLYNNNNNFFAFPLLSTNTVTLNNPSNTYFVSSPLGGIHGELDAGSTFSQAGSSSYGDLGALVQELTNGNWTLLITNTVSTNQYSFKVSVTGVTSNQFAPVIVTFPPMAQLPSPIRRLSPGRVPQIGMAHSKSVRISLIRTATTTAKPRPACRPTRPTGLVLW
jgi:hypothetical protein